MFTEENFEILNSLWDGTLPNSRSVCSTCGSCCHNMEKTLFPGEYGYLVTKTGQRNTEWKSMGCLCMQLGNKYKPVICKVFPFILAVPLTGVVVIDFEISKSAYSSNCSKLEVDVATKLKMQAYINYLFSDIHNRIFYLLTFCKDSAIKKEREYLKQTGKKLDTLSLHERAVFSLLELPIQEYYPYFVH